MTKYNEVYKCELCGNIVEVLHIGAGQLVCCGSPMALQSENITDAATEKHVPIINETDDGYEVRIGSVDHPMEDAHYIEWIELIVDNKTYRQYLKPGESPLATFRVSGANVSAREYCNLHGLWKS